MKTTTILIEELNEYEREYHVLWWTPEANGVDGLIDITYLI